MSVTIPASISPVAATGPLLLKEASLMLKNPYLPFEAGYALNADGHTYMNNVTGPMVDWWFGYVATTDQYKLWHPKDHVYSDWSGPHGNSTYIGGHHLVKEYIGGLLTLLKISFKDPSSYFGPNYKAEFKAANVTTAVCGRVALWEGEGHGTDGADIGHVIHLVHDEFNGVRMRSRFWLGDAEGVTDPQQRAGIIPDYLPPGLMRHTSEEMAILGTFLPALYRQETQKAGSKRRGEDKQAIPWPDG